jgi:fumarate reductase flavoprotein subunit
MKPLVFHCTEYGGSDIIKPLFKNCQESGVKVHFQTKATKLIIDKFGKITGVTAKAGDKDLKIKTKSVVIATGGFGSNKDLLKKYCPFYNEQIKSPGLKDAQMGDGLLMAMDIGAATEGLGNLQISGPIFRGESQSPLPPSFPASAAAKGQRGWKSIAGEPATVWVNKQGERFMEEACSTVFEMVHAVLRQPEQVCFSIFDHGILENIAKNGFARSYRGRVFIPELATIEKGLLQGDNEGIIKISDSWDEIAKFAGVKSEALNITINEYNSCCDDGYDKWFAKDRKHLRPLRNPPYYAIKGFPSFLTTLGGLKVNNRMEVMDQKDKPIEGLYAAGNDTGGWETDTYDVNLSGTTCGFAINSGRIAGENAAKYVFT